VLDADGMLMVF